MKTRRFLGFAAVVFLFVFLTGCAGTPVREPVKVDLKAPMGTIEGNQFMGIRYPFLVSAPPNWKISMDYPKFMIDLGYEKEGLEESEVFIYNPETQSNVQIELTPAGRYSKFDQQYIEMLTGMATGSFEEELKKDYGKDIKAIIAPTEAISLKGVPYAAKKYATYTLKGVKREQGWIYAFAEPYQMFILYMILEKEGSNDRENLKKILDSFEYVPQGAK
jgi:hypothetical protein